MKCLRRNSPTWLIALLSLILGLTACSGGSNDGNSGADSSIDGTVDSNLADNSELALQSAKENGNTNYLANRVQQIFMQAMGIESMLPPVENNPINSQYPVMLIGMQKAAEEMTPDSMTLMTIGDSGLTENSDEWLILEESFDPSTGMFRIVIKVTYNDISNPWDFSLNEMLVDTKMTKDRADDIMVGLNQQVSYRDGSFGKITVEDLDSEGEFAGDLAQGKALVTEARTYDTEKIKGSLGQVEVKLNTPNDKSDDEFLRLFRAVEFADGTKVAEELLPEPPLLAGTEASAGVFKRLITVGQPQDLTTYSMGIDFEADGSGKIHEEAQYLDSTQGLRDTIYSANGVVKFHALDRNGTESNGVYNKAEGTHKLEIIFPEDHPVAKVEEAGKITVAENGDGEGDIGRKITFKSGDVVTEKITFTRTGNVTKILTSNSAGGKGGMQVTKNPASTSTEGRWTDAKGNVTDFIALYFGDGTSIQSFVIDNPNTPAVKPDVEGEITYAPDQSGIGTIKVHQRTGAIVTYRVIYNADGSGSVIDEQGNHHPFVSQY